MAPLVPARVPQADQCPRCAILVGRRGGGPQALNTHAGLRTYANDLPWFSAESIEAVICADKPNGGVAATGDILFHVKQVFHDPSSQHGGDTAAAVPHSLFHVKHFFELPGPAAAVAICSFT